MTEIECFAETAASFVSDNAGIAMKATMTAEADQRLVNGHNSITRVSRGSTSTGTCSSNSGLEDCKGITRPTSSDVPGTIVVEKEADAEDKSDNEKKDWTFNESSLSSTGVYFNDAEVFTSVHPLQECSSKDEDEDKVSKIPFGMPLPAPPRLFSVVRVKDVVRSSRDRRRAAAASAAGKKLGALKAPSMRLMNAKKRVKSNQVTRTKLLNKSRDKITPSSRLSPDQLIFVEAAAALSNKSVVVSERTSKPPSSRQPKMMMKTEPDSSYIGSGSSSSNIASVAVPAGMSAMMRPVPPPPFALRTF